MKTFHEWFEAERLAERLFWADEEAAEAAWKACEAQMAEQMAQVAKTALGVA